MLSGIQNILMIDDDTDDQFLFLDALKQLNQPWHCEIANNGCEALKKLVTPPPPDIIFLDLNMPVMNGFECLRSLRAEEKFKDIPVIIYTTTNGKESMELLKNLGATAFFQKPIDVSHLPLELKKLLSLVAQNKANPVAGFVI